MKIAKTVFRRLWHFSMKANEDNPMKPNEDRSGAIVFHLEKGDCIVKHDTGEAYEAQDGDRISTKEDRERAKHYLQKSNNDGRRNWEYENSLEVRGSFTVVLCKDFENIYRSDISSPTLNKLIYLSTFIGSDNILSRDGGWNGFKRDEEPMSLEEIKAALKISDPSWRIFWRECQEKNLIIEEGGKYKLPIDMFRFCNNSKINRKKVAMISLFRHAVRYMYENTDEHSKRVLNYLYRLIPFINLKYNILCTNPFEQDRDKIVPLKASDICEKFGVPVKNQARFVQQLKKLRFEDNLGRKHSVITYRWIVSKDEEIFWVTINPAFYVGYMSVADSLTLMDEFLLEDESESR